ncbi:hypothetical protein RIF29_15695 [Crotalaria pallida]|uniref:Uncharacterized protein n=1 Tax=Crotalaria pallida TaxID=3830 RepID=A0AAN9IDT0_CROPI
MKAYMVMLKDFHRGPPPGFPLEAILPLDQNCPRALLEFPRVLLRNVLHWLLAIFHDNQPHLHPLRLIE